MLSVGRRRLLATVIIFPVLAVMFLTISDSSVAEQDDGSGALSVIMGRELSEKLLDKSLDAGPGNYSAWLLLGHVEL